MEPGTDPFPRWAQVAAVVVVLTIAILAGSLGLLVSWVGGAVVWSFIFDAFGDGRGRSGDGDD